MFLAMAKNLVLINLLPIIFLQISSLMFVDCELTSKYKSFNTVCKKCNCTKPDNENDPKEQVFMVDCSMKNIDYTVAEWPEDITNYKEIVYLMSFNTIRKVPQLASTAAVLFYICKNCKISEISENAFIDAKNILLLDLSHNEISSDSLNPDIFRGPHSEDSYSHINLEVLDLSHNRINFLDEKLFEHIPNLKKLFLSYNNLKELSDGTLRALTSCTQLEILHLENVGISEIPPELLKNMHHLFEIVLNNNLFLEIPAALEMFGSNLKILYFDRNFIECINSTNLQKLEKLEKLSISFMPSLKLVEKGSFAHLESLKVFNFTGNKKVDTLIMEDFLHLNQLMELDVSNNSLQRLNLEEILEFDKKLNEKKVDKKYFASLHTLKLGNNPWKCDCSLIRDLSFFDHNSTYFTKAMKADEARCASPNNLLSKLLYILPLDYVCAADYKSKPMKIPVYEPPQFLRPKSIMLTIGSVLLVIVLGTVIGILIVCISRRLKSNSTDGANTIRYSVVRNSAISNVDPNIPYQQP